MRSFALNLRLKWLLGVHGRLSRKQGPRVWSFLFEAWAREIIWGISSIWMVFKTVSLDDIIKIVRTDRDKSELCKDPGAL